MVLGLAGCGEIPYDEITGDWTTKSINGQSAEDYAADHGVTKGSIASNLTITDDGRAVMANYAVSQNYTYERKSNGIVLKQEDSGDVVMPIECNADEQTLSYSVDANGTKLIVVMEKGTTPLVTPETSGS
jgi:hypothetical protein